jgi:hypothetical protein
MTENDRLADEVSKELIYAIAMFQSRQWTTEKFLLRLQQIMKAANL